MYSDCLCFVGVLRCALKESKQELNYHTPIDQSPKKTGHECRHRSQLITVTDSFRQNIFGTGDFALEYHVHEFENRILSSTSSADTHLSHNQR